MLHALESHQPSIIWKKAKHSLYAKQDSETLVKRVRKLRFEHVSFLFLGCFSKFFLSNQRKSTLNIVGIVDPSYNHAHLHKKMQVVSAYSYSRYRSYEKMCMYWIRVECADP